MSGDLAVSFAIKLNDQGSGPATQALNKLKTALKETEGVAKTTAQAAISSFQKLASSREILGIRSEKTIQNEIRQTEAAYKRLADSGQASARELARAQEAVRQRVAGLRQELEGVKHSAGGAGSALRIAMGIVGAGAAAKAVVQGPINQTMNYSLELAHASNIMYAGKSVATRVAGKDQVNDAVMAGVRAAKGGVSREDSLAGMKTLAASNAYGDDPAQAFAVLPTLTKAAAANDARVTDMANIAIKARQNMGLNNTSRVLDIAAQGGIEGQFELRDMAKWLPQQMAYAKRTGLYGEQGFASLVAANQVAMSTAGSTDEAGNNVKNLLAKINSHDTANDAKKLGIDLSGTLAAAQAKGVNGLDAFVNMTEQIAAKDKRLVKLREEAKTAKGEDLRANLEAQRGILEGSQIGKIIQDQQAMSALVSILNDRKRFSEIRDKSLSAKDTNDDLLKLIELEPAAKAQLAAAEAANNMQTALNKVNPLLGAAADGYSALSQEFPVLSAAVTGATLGVTALGASALAAAGALALMGGGKGAGGGVIETAKKFLPGGIGAAARVSSSAVAPLAVMWGISEWAEDQSHDQERVESRRGFGGSVSKWMSYLGYNKDADIETRREKNREGLDTSGELSRPQVIQLQVDGRTLAEVVNGVNARQASRH